ncbi:hypothetical protein DITRI_Ditri07aG0180300 [Diplodiscus trichospermus]
MAIVGAGQLNLKESPCWGSRSVNFFEKLEQIAFFTNTSAMRLCSQVYMAKEIKTGEIVALKKIRMDNEREGFPITAIREIKILKKLRHENVIKLKEVVTSLGPEKDDQGRLDGNKYKGGIYMVFEYMDHDLTGLADRPGMRFSFPQIKCYMQQLLTGLYYCHVNQVPVLHHDIKGSNLLIDNEGNLKLADSGLARSFWNDHNTNLTNHVITLWDRPPELLLGATKYGPAVDMWSVGCIFVELLHGKPIFPGKDEPEQLNKIFELCGAPDEVNWPGVSKIPWYNNFKPTRPMKRCLQEVFRQEYPPRMHLMLSISGQTHYLAIQKACLNMNCHMSSKRRKSANNSANMKNMPSDRSYGIHNLIPAFHLFNSLGKHTLKCELGLTHPCMVLSPPIATGPSHHYGEPRGPAGGPGRYPPNGTSGGCNHANRGGQGAGGGYSSGLYPPQGRGPPYGSSGMPGAGPRGGGGNGYGYGYGVGAPNYSQGGPYGGSGAGLGSNMMGGNCNQQYGWQQ